jgi:tRNA A37 methylthiotransferase MiaB
MNRAKDGNDFRALTQRAFELVPDIGIGTDILVGFPCETDADFEETLAVLRDTPTAYAHVFKYSARPDTPAATMPDRIPPEVADVRAKAVRNLSLAKRRAFNARFLGSEVEVLFESRVRGQWEGYTPNYMLVRMPSSESLTNEFRQVRLDALDDGEGVEGRFV